MFILNSWLAPSLCLPLIQVSILVEAFLIFVHALEKNKSRTNVALVM